MKTELIIALDLPNAEQIPSILDILPSSISWFKVGLELFVSSGTEAINMLVSKNKNVFLDLKLHDIPNTVASAIKSASRYRAGLITIHASGGEAMIKAAKQAALDSGDHPPKIIAVTTLTSLNDQDLQAQGITRPLQTHVIELAKMAVNAGADGIVCSPLEAAILRKNMGPAPLIITPGIRPSDGELNDQKRSSSPETAIRNGSNFLVVGRPILKAADPAAAAIRILREMQIS